MQCYTARQTSFGLWHKKNLGRKFENKSLFGYKNRFTQEIFQGEEKKYFFPDIYI
jgi:hypothetical protein